MYDEMTTPQTIYKLVPAPTITQAWTCTAITMPGVPVQAPSGNNGMWKRLSYAKRIKCVTWYSGTALPVYAYRIG